MPRRSENCWLMDADQSNAIVDACGSCPDEHATLVRRWSAVAFQASADQLFESLRARYGQGICADSAELIRARHFYTGPLLVRATILACGPPDGRSLATTRTHRAKASGNLATADFCTQGPTL